jgi:hypothetical protein
MIFEYNKLYFAHISSPTFGNIPSEIIQEILFDGRPTSHFMERWLPCNFENMEWVPGCKSYDIIIDGKSNRLDVKGLITEKANKKKSYKDVSLIRSNMKGEGRQYDETEYRLYLKDKIGFIIAHFDAKYNIVLVWFIPIGLVLNNEQPRKTMTEQEITNFLGKDINSFKKEFINSKLYGQIDIVYAEVINDRK